MKRRYGFVFIGILLVAGGTVLITVICSLNSLEYVYLPAAAVDDLKLEDVDLSSAEANIGSQRSRKDRKSVV